VPAESVERKLAGILAADIPGAWRLMGTDDVSAKMRAILAGNTR
jgi:hypothetical protein